MGRRFRVLACVCMVVWASTAGMGPAWTAPTMVEPTSGTIGTTGLFLSCRTTTTSASTTPYYDQQDVLRTWDCGEGKRPHKGVDFLGESTPGATPVYAAAAGTVWTAERGNGLGWRIVLRHGTGLGAGGKHVYTIYGHMGRCSTGESLLVPGLEPGTQVNQGQLLGWQGDDSYPNGCVSRTHLHWEVRAYPQDVSNVFLATPASPDFYTGTKLTADPPTSPSPSPTQTPSPSPTPVATPTPSPTPTPTPALPTPTPVSRVSGPDRDGPAPSPYPVPDPDG